MKKIYFLIIFAGILIGSILGFEAGSSLKTIPELEKFLNIKSAPPVIKEKPGLPVRITIPSQNVDTAIEFVQKDQQGRMDIPKTVTNTAWYSLGPRPGEKGSAVIAGHFDTPTGAPSVFYNLSSLKTGDLIEVTDQNGKRFSFSVIDNKTYEEQNMPLEEIFSTEGKPMLNLITCAGFWNINTKTYTQRVVVFSELK